ncbi:hypothetical protein AX16_009362 [Volvariella volvacea WC 439]|nr:hypothetical protein AX16_009362 [Volvariella volvacea WC 439]
MLLLALMLYPFSVLFSTVTFILLAPILVPLYVFYFIFLAPIYYLFKALFYLLDLTTQFYVAIIVVVLISDLVGRLNLVPTNNRTEINRLNQALGERNEEIRALRRDLNKLRAEVQDTKGSRHDVLRIEYGDLMEPMGATSDSEENTHLQVRRGGLSSGFTLYRYNSTASRARTRYAYWD